MATNALFFPAISTVSPKPTDYFRIATKVGNTYNTTLTMDLVFRYFNNNAQFNLTGKYMTLFNMGDSARGFQVCLTRRTSDANPIEIGLRYYMGTGSWSEISGSFISLNSIGNPSVDGYYIMFQYTGGNTVNFYVTLFNNSTTKTTPDFSYNNTGFTYSFGGTNPWGYGSSPESIADATGYLTTNGYNSYVAQNTHLLFLRSWDRLIPVQSSGATTYAMFNSAAANYSLYALNKSQTYVPAGTLNLQFQLFVPISSTSIANLTNNAVTPSKAVTLTANASGIPNLSSGPGSFGMNSSTSYSFITSNVIPCICRDSKILTKQGYKLVQDISYNDILITHDKREVVIKKISNRYILCDENTCPLIIRKGTYKHLEHDIKCEEDLWISQGHTILMGNEFILPKEIHDFEKDLTSEIVQYFHIMTENYYKDTIVANGIPIETWGGWGENDTDSFQHECEPIYNERGHRIICCA